MAQFARICETRAFPFLTSFLMHFSSQTMKHQPVHIKPFVFLFRWMKLQFAQSHYIAHLILPLFNSWIKAASNKGLEIEKICYGACCNHTPAS